MSELNINARRLIERNVRIWPQWDEGGDIRLLLQMVNPDGSPTQTVGSCLASVAGTELRAMMRGLEVGAIIGQTRGE